MNDAGMNFLEKPITTWATGITTSAVGLIVNLTDNLTAVHEILGDVALVAGILACLALLRVHIKRARQMDVQTEGYALENELRRRQLSNKSVGK
jgi:hypothetical protein